MKYREPKDFTKGFEREFEYIFKKIIFLIILILYIFIIYTIKLYNIKIFLL